MTGRLTPDIDPCDPLHCTLCTECVHWRLVRPIDGKSVSSSAVWCE
jgi:hypothetical protein